jgi:hypothetical protein
MLAAVPSPSNPTLELQYLLYVKGGSKDGPTGLGTTPHKHWDPPLGAMNRSSPRVAFFQQNKGECWPIFSDFFQALTPIIRLTFLMFFVVFIFFDFENC